MLQLKRQYAVLQTKIEELEYVNQVLRDKPNERDHELEQTKEQISKHQSVMFDILDKFKTLEKVKYKRKTLQKR